MGFVTAKHSQCVCLFPAPALPSHLLTVKHISDKPFTLSCGSTHLLPRLISWTLNGYSIPGGIFSSHIVNRKNSTYENTLTLPTHISPVGTFVCTATFEVQPYYDYGVTSLTYTSELSSLTYTNEYIVSRAAYRYSGWVGQSQAGFKNTVHQYGSLFH